MAMIKSPLENDQKPKKNWMSVAKKWSDDVSKDLTVKLLILFLLIHEF